MPEKKKTPPDPRNREVGENLQNFRGSRSQTEIAKVMTARGFKWSQNTMYQIEQGERPLRLIEAKELSKLLGFPLELLFLPSESLAAERYVKTLERDLKHQRQIVFQSLRKLFDLHSSYLTGAPQGVTDDEHLRQLKAQILPTYEDSQLWKILIEIADREHYEAVQRVGHLDTSDFVELLESFDEEKDTEELAGVKKSDTRSPYMNERYEELKKLYDPTKREAPNLRYLLSSELDTGHNEASTDSKESDNA